MEERRDGVVDRGRRGDGGGGEKRCGRRGGEMGKEGREDGGEGRGGGRRGGEMGEEGRGDGGGGEGR